MNPVRSIIRASIRQKNEPLNILTFPTHERYETGLAMTGHNFYAYRAEGIKNWNITYALLPDNYVLLDPSRGDFQVPNYIEFDLVLSQNKFGQYQKATQLANKLHLPLISLEHTLPYTGWKAQQKASLRNMRGLANVFISEYSLKAWDWEPRYTADMDADTFVIHHMVNTDIFTPGEYERENHLLSVVNDWINRDWCCNFQGWQRITQGLPTKVVGDTPGLSTPAATTLDLIKDYQTSRIFLNTSVISPIPTAMLEAMACACVPVSTATCMIPEIIEHGVNGFISNDETELRNYCIQLLNDAELAQTMGRAARETILAQFHKDRFVQQWKDLFESIASLPYGVPIFTSEGEHNE